ncbi:MAG TPA: L-serine ammonia-lyase, partial [Gaiellaceae bacterium]|nr:L-serine ammonia-lyase [Gaiellaceae bacterium]
MFLSVFELFKVGIGPSSSHTMGPMTAAADFLDLLRASDARGTAASVRASLHGSLAFTGKGHGTDRAVALGLLGYRPADVDLDEAERRLDELRRGKRLAPAGLPALAFDPATAIVFDYGPPLPGHTNGLALVALDAAGEPILSETYYSIGGGFVVTAAQREEHAARGPEATDPTCWPYPFDTAAAMLRTAQESGLSIAAMKRANEGAVRPEAEVDAGLARIWRAMEDCLERGLSRDGDLPGGLRVRRRAKRIRDQLERERGSNTAQPHVVSDWLNVYAMAVNEENAAGGKVVTAPTNGAAGVVPAVIRYYLDHCVAADPAKVPDFLLTAA